MKKDRTKRRKGKARTTGKPVLDPRQSLLQVVLAKGFEEVHAWLEADREELCGPLRRWQPERQAYRYGYDQGPLVLGGRKVRVR